MARVVAGGARVRLLWIVLVALSLVAAGLPAVADAASDSDATTNTSDYNRSPKHELPRVGQTYWLTSEWEPETSYLNRRGIDGMPANGIWLAELNETSQTWDSMRWRFEPAGKGFYRIANGFGPKTGYLTRKSRGGNTVTFTSHKKRSTRQLWRLESLGGDRIRISSGSRDKAHLHRHGIKQSDGSYLPSTDVRLSPKNENGSMIWRFRNVKDGLPVPMFELFAPSRVTTSALTETSMSLLWFPGVGGSGDLTYDVLVDGMPVVTGLTDVRHTLDGLDPKTQYSISVRAVDETGTAAASEIFEIGTQSTGRCADLVVTVELVRGEAPTDGDDVILGTEGDDVIDGLGGNDVICGLGGADNLSGGPGDDLVIGGDGLDVISGGPGDDLLVGQADADQLDGGEDNDEVFGGPGADQISGGAGDDQLYGEADADRIDGGVGADSLVGGGGGDTLIGGEGPDNIAGGPGNDTAHGGDESGAEEAGVDSIDGGPGDDVITGAADDDDLLGDVGDDNIDGGPGDDRIVGGPGNNTMVGGPGADLFVEPTGTFDQTSEDSVEQTYTATQTGGSFDTCPEGGFVDLIRGNRYECDWPFFLFAYAPDPVIAHEWGLDILFDCALDPIPGASGELQCLRMEQFAGLPPNVEALTSNQTVQNYFREAYATFRSWGMWRPFDAYFAFDIDDPEWPEVTTVVTFTDDASFRSRSVEPGLIEYGVTAGLTQREVTSDMFSQFIYRRILPDSAIYEANEATLDSLNEWVTGRIVNNDNPISCTLVTCSRRLAVDEGRGVLLWEYMLEETGGYGFIERLLTRLAAGNSTKAALNLELGLGWTRDFLAANEPTGSDSLDVGFSGLEATAFDLTWVNLAQASTYEILIGGSLFAEEIPNTGATTGEFLVEVGEPNTVYAVELRALDSIGRVLASDRVSLRTPSLPPATRFNAAAAFSVATERCINLGGDLFLDDAAQNQAAGLLTGASEISPNCFDFGQSACLAQMVAAIDNPAQVDCDDALTQALAPFDQASVTPAIAAIPSVAATAAGGAVIEVGLACVTTPIQSPCAAWAARNLPPGGVPAAGGVRILPLLGKAGVFVVVTVGAFLLINELLDNGLACGVILARPEGFDPNNPDFTRYADPDAMEQVTRCGDVAGASKIYGTVMQTINDRIPDFNWDEEGDAWLTNQIRRTCAEQGQSGSCEDKVAVYVPGGTTYSGRPFLFTGTHINAALEDGPVVWHFPAYAGPRVNGNSPSLIAKGLDRNWYSKSPNVPPGNPCFPTAAPNWCDEFPFASTDQAGFTAGAGGAIQWASLLPVPVTEGRAQSGELSKFYSRCLSPPKNTGERFIIISPPQSYITAGGPSFAFRVDPASLRATECFG